MAKTTYAAIDPAIWDKPWFIDAPNPYKLVFIWLLANKHKNCTGIYEVHLRRIAEGSSQTLEDTQSALDHFTRIGKVFYEDGYIIIANWHKRSHYNNQDVRNFVIHHISTLPTSLTTNHPDIIAALLEKCGQGSDHHPGQGGRQGTGHSRIVNMNTNMNMNNNPPISPQGKSEVEDPEKIVTVNGVLMRNREVYALVELMGGDDAAYQRITKKVRAYYDKKNTDPDDGYKACVKFWKNEQQWKLEESDGKHPNRKKSAK